MSKLVQVWESSYVFNEDEMGFFAQSQKKLSQPFIVPNVDLIIDESSRWFEEMAMKTVLDHVQESKGISSDTKYPFLEAQMKRAESLINILELLGKQVIELQNSHEKVKSKSLVMQSLWDGLVTRQPDHLDSTLYAQRYQNIIDFGSKSLLRAIMEELDGVTKASSLRLREATLTILADVNADFLVSVLKLSSAVQVLGSCAIKECSEGMIHVANRYFSCRSSLLYHFFTAFPLDTSTPPSAVTSLIEMMHHVLKEERSIAERLFGPLLPSFSIQYKQFVESFLLPILKRIRSIYEESGDEKRVTKAAALEVLLNLRSSRTNTIQAGQVSKASQVGQASKASQVDQVSKASQVCQVSTTVDQHRTSSIEDDQRRASTTVDQLQASSTDGNQLRASIIDSDQHRASGINSDQRRVLCILQEYFTQSPS